MDNTNYVIDDSVKQIAKIDFDILGNDEIKNMSAVKKTQGIDIPDLYENLEPKKGGLIDPRLGTTDNNNYCATCGLNTSYCVGHFGHIDLAENVYHLGYIQYVKRILDVVCLNCSKLLINKNEAAIIEMQKVKHGKNRLSELRSVCKNVQYCRKSKQGCGAPVSKIKIEIKKAAGTCKIISETDVDTKEDVASASEFSKQKIKMELSPEIIYSILKNVSSDDLDIMGLKPHRSRPEDMIHKVFPVPPVQVRPSARGDFMGGTTMEDDLTHKLADIVKANNRLQKQKDSDNVNNNKYSKDHIHLLQFHIASFFDQEAISQGKTDQKGKPFKPLAPRLKSKEGRVRGNLMGKRGDFTGRTVITSDPTISINQVGIPVKIAKTLTFPETVTPLNKEKLQELVRRGRDEYPGANHVFQASSIIPGQRLLPIDLRYRKDEIDLKYGDIVERHIVDGDIALLNRQPTLHKQSMMGHYIKVIDNDDYLTYRLSVGVTTPYNADRLKMFHYRKFSVNNIDVGNRRP